MQSVFGPVNVAYPMSAALHFFTMTSRRVRFAGLFFDHMHMGDLLRLVSENPGAEIAGIADPDPAKLRAAIETFRIPPDLVFADPDECLANIGADVAILCPTTGAHASATHLAAGHAVHVLVEKPFAANLADADSMIDAVAKTGKRLAINWPLAWYPPHITTKRLIDDGVIGDVLEIHYYDGNRGPLRHVADKVEISEEDAAREKSKAWWYQKDAAGGSLQDYLGYGVTLGTWFLSGRAPASVTCVTDDRPGLEVDEHAIVVCRYENPVGLSKFETRWGTFTDPWTQQPQPKCGFVVVGTRGTISSYDYESTVRVQTRAHPEGETVPVDQPAPGFRDPIEHLIHVLETGANLHGPLDPMLCRTAQRIVDAAARSAKEKRTVTLADFA